MKKALPLVLASYLLIGAIQAQTFIADVESVYGGSIKGITGGKVGSYVDSFRVFIATESANSIFYADGNKLTIGNASIKSFTVLPSTNAAAGLGSGIEKLAYHKASGKVFFINLGNLYASSITALSATLIVPAGMNGPINDLAIVDNNILFTSFNMGNTYVSKGSLDAVGNYTAATTGTIAGSFDLHIGNNADSVYLFQQGTAPKVYKFNHDAATLNFPATYVSVSPVLSPTIFWKTMGVATDGKIFIGGSDNMNKHVANGNINSAVFTSVNTGIAGTFGNNIDFYTGLLGNYYVYFGSAYSNAKGAASTWFNFGNISFETHPNDGAVFTLGTNLPGGVILCTTDQGLGWSKNSGEIIREIDEGIEAVQVNDFDMRSAKDFGWLASKAGIRYVRNYNTASKSWSSPMFPNGDGSPYYACEMVGKTDSNSVYVGNVRVYKTTNKGANWTQVFTAEAAPYNFSGQSQVRTIAVSDSMTNVVLVGYNDPSNNRGGVFYSMNGGTSWNQLLCYASTTGQDIDVNDIEITSDSGKIVAYIGVDYDNSVSPPITGMYKAQYNGASWSVSKETIYSPSSSLIRINDIVIHSRDTIMAVGGFNNTVYGYEYGIMFSISRPVYNAWTSNVVTTHNPYYSACYWNGDTLFYACRDTVWYRQLTYTATGTAATAEKIYSTVPKGTEINVLYYDELLGGNGTGFYAFRPTGPLPIHISKFTATSKREGNLISWTNDTEADVLQYELEVSCDGIHFIGAANIKATGERTYQHIDKTPCNNIIHYRLKVHNKNGSIEYSKIITLRRDGNKQVKVYPNPVTKGTLTIELSTASSSNIIIFDALAKERLRLNGKAAGIHSLNTSSLNPGTYYMQVVTGTERKLITIIVQ